MSELAMVSQQEVQHAEVIVEAVNRAEDVRNQLLALKRADEKSFLTKGAYMQEVRDQKHYKHFGYRNLEEFCLKELEYGARQVRTFVRVYERFLVDLKIDETKLLEVGSTKLAILSDVVTGKNVKELLEYAHVNSVPNVNNKVSALLGDAILDHVDEMNGKPVLWQIPLTPSQRDLVNETLELAKQLNGSDWAAAALEGICADYQSGLEHDASRIVLTFTVTEHERDVIGLGLEKSKAAGFQTVGAFLTELVRQYNCGPGKPVQIGRVI